MTLKLVKKSDRTQKTLLKDEQEIVLRKYASSNNPDKKVFSMAQNILGDAHNNNQWLECYCKVKEDEHVILVPCLISGSGKFYYRALSNDDNEHSHDCEFNRVHRDWNPELLWDKDRKARKAPEGLFEVLRESSEDHELVNQNSTQPSKNKAQWSPRRPALSQQLLKVMEKAELNKLSSVDNFAIRRDRDKEIRDLITAIDIAPGILLSEFWFSDVGEWNDGTVHRKMTEAAMNWPDGHKPQGFLCWFVWDVDNDGVEKKGNKRVDVINRVKRPVIFGKPVGEPYLFLGVVGLPANEQSGYQCVQAYAQPIVATYYPIPVDSQSERVAFGKIKYRLNQILKDYPDVEFEITKPVFEIETNAGLCLPDFIITARRGKNEEKFIIEVMGFDRPDYLQAKEVTHPRMEMLGTLITMDASKFRETNAEKNEGFKVGQKICEKLQLKH